MGSKATASNCFMFIIVIFSVNFRIFQDELDLLKKNNESKLCL